ncbi:hypothetical protein F4604DRAFT_675312 [Suillus subluteus]|nr:hypothetical protein F4604DRAFT_675312 [Suillus subluteus]
MFTHNIRMYVFTFIIFASRGPPNTHTRMALNNQLLIIFGSSASERVRWEVYSQGPLHAPTWHATLYINDINYGHGTTHTKGRAQEMAAMQVAEYLDRGSREHAGRIAQMERTDVSESR